MRSARGRSSRAPRIITFGRDVGLLLLGRYGQYAVAIVTIPLTARWLGVAGLGAFAIATALYFFGSIAVDMGLSQLLVADAAREGDLRPVELRYAELRRIALMLQLAVVVVSLFTKNEILVASAIGFFAGGVSSANDSWKYYGRGDFIRPLVAQGTGRLAYLALMVVLLPVWPAAWTCMACLAVSNVLTNLVVPMARRRNEPRGSSRELLRMIKTGAPSVASRALFTAYGQSSAFFYSLTVPVQQVGLYGAGDKLLRAAQSVFDALGLALIPRLVRVTGKSRLTAVRRSAGAAILVATVMAAVLAVAAPLIQQVLLGPQFVDSIPMMRAQALMLPGAAAASVFVSTVLYVEKDQVGIVLSALVGSIGAAIGVLSSLMWHSSWSLVLGAVLSEWLVAAYSGVRAVRVVRRAEA